MDVTPLIRRDQQVIQSYSNGVFKVSDVTYDQAVLVMPDETCTWNVDQGVGVSDLTLDDFSYLIERAADIDVVLLGCGKKMELMPPILRSDLKNAGLSVDIMDTGAACRTYNVLMAEGRRVFCALLPA